MPSFAAVIFDMDGVLFDSEPLHIQAWQLALAEHGVSITSEEMTQWIGYHDSEFAQYCHRNLVALPPDTLVRMKRERYYDLAEEQLDLYPGVEEGIRKLVAYNMPLAVGTSSSGEELAHSLGRMKVVSSFGAIVTGDEIGNRKPAPDTFLLAAERLGVNPHQCVIIEDSPAGVAAGRAAGCTVLGVTTSYQVSVLREAHHIFPATADALQWILWDEIGGGGRDSNPR